MICTPCASAGRILASSRDYREHGAFSDAESLLGMAEVKHTECEARTTCPCQHLTGHFVS